MFTHTLLPVWLVCLCFKEGENQSLPNITYLASCSYTKLKVVQSVLLTISQLQYSCHYHDPPPPPPPPTHTHTVTAAGQTTSQLPTFTLHPQSDILAPGESTNLTCSASSPTPLSYGWLRDGVSLDGESLPWYVVTMGTNGEGAGRYSCLANNDLGTVTSRVANVQQAGECLLI